MRNTTHELVGVSLALVASRATDTESLPTAALAASAVWGSWLPDVDTPGARVHRRTRLERHSLVARGLGVLLRAPLLTFALLVRHRGFTHALVACAAVSVLVAMAVAVVGGPGLGGLVGLGVAVGYGAHLAADACTPGGAPLWWPLSTRRIWLLPKQLRIPTGSWRELPVAVAAAALGLAAVI